MSSNSTDAPSELKLWGGRFTGKIKTSHFVEKFYKRQLYQVDTNEVEISRCH